MATEVNDAKLQEFLGKVVTDVGAAMSAALVIIGDKLGLYRAMAASGPITPVELAKRTETTERYVREWLNAQAAGGYVTFDPASGRYTLPPEQALALADDTSPAFVPGLFQVTQASGGTSIRACSRVPSASSDRGTSATSPAPGYPPSMASWPSSPRGPRSPTWAAVSVRRRS